MPRTWSICFASAALLAAANAQDKASHSDDALATARRDLQSLNDTDAAGLNDRKLPTSDLELPDPNLRVESSSTNSDAHASSGWLLDALQAKETLPHGTNANPNKADAARLTDLSKTANPFDQYLSHWLASDNPSVLKLEQINDAALGIKKLDGTDKATPQSNADTLPSTDPQKALNVFLEPRKNPYLDADRELTVTLQTTLPEKNPNVRTAPLTQSIDPVFDPTTEDKNTTQKSANSDRDLPPPNAPLIDEQRYFPQLRRF